MYLQFLKELYCKERKKLEEMWIYKQEAKLQLLRFRKEAIGQIKGRLTMPEISGRSDIAEEIKDNLLRDGSNEDKVKERLDALIDAEVSDIENAEKEELRNAKYSAFEFAEYLFQLEKVCALESELGNNRLFSEEVYNEQRETAQEKEGGAR